MLVKRGPVKQRYDNPRTYKMKTRPLMAYDNKREDEKLAGEKNSTLNSKPNQT
jgi:hypothetical protein